MACMAFSLEFYVRHTNVIQSTLQASRIDNSFVNYMHITTKLVHKCLVVHSHLSDEALKKFLSMDHRKHENHIRSIREHKTEVNTPKQKHAWTRDHLD